MARKTAPTPPQDAPTADRVWKGNPKIEPHLVPLDSVLQDPNNARFHPEDQLRRIAASLAKFGQQTPIVAGSDGVIRKGNGTHSAARSLGWTHIGVLVSDLHGTDLTGYAIADNRSTHGAEDDLGVLASLLNGMVEEGYEVEATGFSPDEVEAILREAEKDPSGGFGEEPDDAEAPTGLADVVISVGLHRFTVDRPVYEAWYAALTADAGLAEEAIVAEVKRRLRIG